MLASMSLDDFTVIGHGAVQRAETIVVTAEDRVFASSGSDAAVSEICADGSVRPVGDKPGETNGMSMLNEHTIVFTVFDTGEVCTLDLRTEDVTVIADSVDGHRLTAPNFALAGPDGTVWVSLSAAQDDVLNSLGHMLADGSIVRIDPDGTTTTVATEIPFANCMTFDRDMRHLYVSRSTSSDVGRYELLPSGELRDRGRYGPTFGVRHPDEVGPDFGPKAFDPQVGPRWALTDGCTFDVDGNLWVTLMSANKIVAITPEGEVVTVVEDPYGDRLVVPSSVAFGGPDMRDLYIGSLVAPYILKARSPVAGQRFWYQKQL